MNYFEFLMKVLIPYIDIKDILIIFKRSSDTPH